MSRKSNMRQQSTHADCRQDSQILFRHAQLKTEVQQTKYTAKKILIRYIEKILHGDIGQALEH